MTSHPYVTCSKTDPIEVENGIGSLGRGRGIGKCNRGVVTKDKLAVAYLKRLQDKAACFHLYHQENICKGSYI